MESQAPAKVAHVVTGGTPFLLAVPDAETDYIQGRVAAEQRPYEEALLRDIAGRVTRDDIVVDVGANVGNHTLYLACVAGCRVHAFEPDAHLAEAIRTSARLNEVTDRVHIHEQGVGVAAGRGSLVLDDVANLGGQRIVLDELPQRDQVAITTLDEMDLGGRVAALKIDVEGMEIEVLLGGEQLLERDRPLVYVECLDVEHFTRVERFLGDRGYLWGEVFNASPTHLFLPDTDAGPQLRELLRRRALAEYELREAAASDRRALNAANARYRQLADRVVEHHGHDGEGTVQLVELLGRLDASTKESTAARDELARLSHVLADQTAAYDAALKRWRQLARELTAQAERTAARDERLAKLQERLAQLEAALQARADDLRRAREERHALDRKVQQAEAAQAAQSRKREEADETVRRLEGETGERNTRLGELHDHVNRLQGKVDAEGRRRAQRQADLRVVRNHIEQLQARLESSAERLAAVEGDLAKALAAGEQLEERSQQLEAHVGDLARQLAEASRARAQLEASHAALVGRHQKLAAEATRRARDLAAMRRARDRFAQERDELTADFTERLAQLEGERSRLEAERSRLEADLAVATLSAAWESRSRLEAREQLQALRGSSTYQVGVAMRNAGRSPKGLATLLPTLVSAWRTKTSDGGR